MTHLAPPSPASPDADPGRQVASLREILALVQNIAGVPGEAHEARLQEAATISDRYERASPVARRRFDGEAAEIAAWAAAGAEALLSSGQPPRPAAARRLALHLQDSLERLIFSLR